MNNHNRIRTSAVFRAVAFFGLFSLIGISATFGQQTRMFNMDLMGLDYKVFDIDPTVPVGVGASKCSVACLNDPKCKAWTYVKPGDQGGTQGPNGRCWLKFAIPNVSHNICCISGVPRRDFEPNIDRAGNDYKRIDFSVIAPNPELGPLETCRDACKRDGNCKAWTFVKPPHQGPKGVCWLKNEVPDARTSDCCVSGVMVRRTLRLTRPTP